MDSFASSGCKFDRKGLSFHSSRMKIARMEFLSVRKEKNIGKKSCRNAYLFHTSFERNDVNFPQRKAEVKTFRSRWRFPEQRTSCSAICCRLTRSKKDQRTTIRLCRVDLYSRDNARRSAASAELQRSRAATGATATKTISYR